MSLSIWHCGNWISQDQGKETHHYRHSHTLTHVFPLSLSETHTRTRARARALAHTHSVKGHHLFFDMFTNSG